MTMTTENLIPFCLESAKNGAALRTRDGRRATFVLFIDSEGITYPLRVNIDGIEIIYTDSGKYFSEGDSEHDLFMDDQPPVAEVATLNETTNVAGEAMLGFVQAAGYAEGLAKIITNGMDNGLSLSRIREYAKLYDEFAG